MYVLLGLVIVGIVLVALGLLFFPARRNQALKTRISSAFTAFNRQNEVSDDNGDEAKYADSLYFMSFTKGLPHNPHTGLLHDPQNFLALRKAIDDGLIAPFTTAVTHGATVEVDLDETKKSYIQKGFVA